MKKIFGIVVASMMFANIGFAEITLIEDIALKGNYGKSNFHLATICVDGYKFVVTKGGTGRSMVQFFEERDGKSLPTKC